MTDRPIEAAQTSAVDALRLAREYVHSATYRKDSDNFVRREAKRRLEIIDAALASAPPAAATVPGHKLTPHQPTKEMLQAGAEQWHRVGTPADAWMAMWHAAPEVAPAAATVEVPALAKLDSAIAGLDYFLTNKEERRFITSARASLVGARAALSTPTAQKAEGGEVPDLLPWLQTVIAALKRLSFAAQTTGGTAGPDQELTAAIAQAERAMSFGGFAQSLRPTPAAAAPQQMSRESRAMLLNVLWHHQGGSSPVGQPLRKLLGIEQHAHLTDEELAEAKWIDKALADGVRSAAAAGVPPGYVLVPLEPTNDMVDAAILHSNEWVRGTTDFAGVYRAMIAASGAPSGNGCDDCAGQGTYSDGLPCDTCKGAVSGAPAGAPKGEQQ